MGTRQGWTSQQRPVKSSQLRGVTLSWQLSWLPAGLPAKQQRLKLEAGLLAWEHFVSRQLGLFGKPFGSKTEK